MVAAPRLVLASPKQHNNTASDQCHYTTGSEASTHFTAYSCQYLVLKSATFKSVGPVSEHRAQPVYFTLCGKRRKMHRAENAQRKLGIFEGSRRLKLTSLGDAEPNAR